MAQTEKYQQHVQNQNKIAVGKQNVSHLTVVQRLAGVYQGHPTTVSS